MNDHKNIKNVILDLGRVLVDIDVDQTHKAFKRIFLPETFLNINWEELPDVVVEMETGRLSKKKFKKRMLESCKAGVSASQIIDAWCAMILEFKAIRVGMVKELAEKYNVYLLSNNNVYHVSYIEEEFKNRYHSNFKDLFTKVYYSNEIGFRKPNAEAFEYVLNDANLKAEETVLVDDRHENCLAAEKLGIKAIEVPANTGLEKVIKQLV